MKLTHFVDGTPLEQEVQRIVNNNIEDYDKEETKKFFEDLAQHGCGSGMIGDLIYYRDTVAFYERHQEEIDQMVDEMSKETGQQPIDMFNQHMIDRDDPLFRGDINKNILKDILAWFAFEEVARNLAIEAGYEI